MTKRNKENLLKVGAAIKVLRLLQDLTQHELGSLVGVSKATISEIEKGNRDVSLSKLDLYANALSVSTTELLTIARAYSEDEKGDFLSKVIRQLCSIVKDEAKFPSGGIPAGNALNPVTDT